MSQNATMNMKKPAPMMETLRQGFDWIMSNIALILGLVAVVLVIGVGMAIWSHFSHSNEMKWMEKYASIEKGFLQKKRDFQEAQQKSEMKKKDPKAPDVPAAALATGDMTKDYGTFIGDFEALIEQAPKTRGAEMAALNLAVLQSEHGKNQEALAVLNKVNTSDRTSEAVGALVVNLKASLMASMDQCPAALEKFQKVAGDKKAAFLHQEAKLRMGLCYEKMNDLPKAQAMYQEVSSAAPAASENNPPGRDTGLSEEASRYLRLLKTKQMDQRGS